MLFLIININYPVNNLMVFCSIDLDQKHIYISLCSDRVELESKYEIDGKISFFPIKGKGPMHLKLGKYTIILHQGRLYN